MKREKQDQARALRAKGFSINHIAAELNVAKGSVSVWVRDIQLTNMQQRRLSENGRSVASIETRRKNRIANTLAKHQVIIDDAKKSIQNLSQKELLLVGTALYWGEGGKTKKGMARLANADPKVIRFTMRYFREIFHVEESRFRGHVHTFSHQNVEKAESYWAEISGIPRKQFYKTYAKPSKAGKGHKDSLPYGTFQIYVCDTNVFLTIMGWIEGLAEFGEAKL